MKKAIASLGLMLCLLLWIVSAQAAGIVIPADTQVIGAYAFYDLPALSGELVIPDGVKYIGEYAFSGCKGLSGELHIPDSVAYIGPYAFDGTGLTGTIYAAEGRAVDPLAFAGSEIVYVDELEIKLLWQVNEDGETVTITGLSGSPSDGLTIPAELGGCKVIAIADSAFRGRTDITGPLTLPEGLTKIGACAFQNCVGLTGTMTLPESLSVIGGGAFSGCSGLTGSIVVPDSVRSIGQEAFANCTGFTGVPEVGNQYCVIGKRVYAGCSGLTRESYFTFTSNGDGTCAVTDYQNRKDETMIRIPAYSSDGDRVTSIGRSAFTYCRMTPVVNGQAYDVIYNVYIPEGVTYIGEYAFARSYWNHVSLPTTLKTIDNYAFYDTSYLTSIHLPEGLTTLGHYAFQKCEHLSYVNIPASIRSIYHSTFSGTNLYEITLPEGIMGINSFGLNVYGMSRWVLPRSIQFIADNATGYHPAAIYGYSGTVAETYAASNGIPFYDRDAAQFQCGIRVTVLDPEGLPMPGAVVNIVDLDGALITNATTGDDGFCLFTGMEDDDLFYIFIEKEPYNFSVGLYVMTEGIIEECTLQAKYLTKAYMDILTPVDGAKMTGTSVNVTYAPVTGAEQYRIDLYDTADSTAPIKTVTFAGMSHVLNDLTPGHNYRLTVTAIALDGTEETDETTFYITSGLEPCFVSFDIPSGSHRTGDVLTFTVYVENADAVTLLVDGEAYDTVEVTDGRAVINRAFTKAGEREVSFLAAREGQPAAQSTALSLSIIAAETLLEPVVSPVDNLRLGQPLTVSWQASPNATEYVVYLFREGVQIYREAVQVSGEGPFSLEIPATAFTSDGAYGVEVIATAAGYSQCSGSATFTVYEFTPYTAYLQCSSATLYQERALTTPVGTCSYTTPLTVMDAAEGGYLVKSNGNVTGWLPVDLLGSEPWVPETRLQCWYKRYNPADPDSRVLVTIWATLDVTTAQLTLPDGVIASADHPQPITGTPDMQRFLIEIDPVKEQTALPIAGCDARGKALITATLNIPPVERKEETLPVPVIAANHVFEMGKSAVIRWTGSTGADSYVVTLTKDGVNVFEPITYTSAVGVTGLTPANLAKAGEYVFTITAQKEGWKSASATSTIRVVDGNFMYLQQTNGGSHASFRYLMQITAGPDYMDRYTLSWTDATGQSHSDLVSKDLLGFTPYMPETAPVLDANPVRLSSHSHLEGTIQEITLTTDMIAESVEIYVAGKKAADMTLSSEISHCRYFKAQWTLAAGEQELVFKVKGVNGLTTKYAYKLVSTHVHQLDMNKAVFSALSNTSVTISSGSCTTCGESLAGTEQPLARVFGSNVSGTSNSLQISIPLSLPGVHVNVPGKVTIYENGSLVCAGVSCKALEVRGALHAGSISCTSMDIKVNGKLSMADGDTASVTELYFRSHADHSSLLTGGTLTISGNMTGGGTFKANAAHQTVFTNAVHKLELSSASRFGTLVIRGIATNLRSSRSFSYEYIVIPKVAQNPMAEAVPQEPSDTLKQYEDAYCSNGYYYSTTTAKFRISQAVRNETYATITSQNFMTTQNMNRETLGVFQLLYTNEGKSYNAAKRDIAVQLAGLNALNDGHAAGANIFNLIATYTIKHRENGSYQCMVNGVKTKVNFTAWIEGIAQKSGNKTTGMLTVEYSEWIDGGTVYSSVVSLTPTFKAIDELLGALDWGSKKLVQEKIDEAAETVYDEYEDMFLDLLNCENINKAKKSYDLVEFCTEHSVSSADEARAPALTVFANDASFSIYDSYGAPSELMDTFEAMYDVN